MTTLYHDEYVHFGLTSDGALHLAPVTGGYGIPDYNGNPNAPLIDQYGELHTIVWQAFAKLYALYDQRDNRKALMVGNRLVDGMREANSAMLDRLVDSGYAPDTWEAWARLCEERPKGYQLAWRIHD